MVRPGTPDYAAALAAAAARDVAASPPLTDEQVAKLALIIRAIRRPAATSSERPSS